MKALFFVALLYSPASLAQHTIVVKPGTSINQSIPQGELYQYSQFRPGRVFYKDGHTAAGKMNYHRLYDEMQFIAANGDTLAVDNEPTIKLITVDSDTFYYAGGWARLISSTPAARLVRRQRLSIADREKYGGYGQTSSTSSIASLKTLDDGRRSYDLLVKENLIITRSVQYLLGDQWDHFVLVNKKNVLGLYPQHSEAIKSYIKEHRTDFKNEEDLEKLAGFLKGL